MLRLTSRQRPEGRSGDQRGRKGDGIDGRAGGVAEDRGRQSRFRLGASRPRMLPGAASEFDGGEARFATARSRGGRRRSRNSAAADSYEKPGRVAQCCAAGRAAAGGRSQFRFGASRPWALPGAASALDGGGARRPARDHAGKTSEVRFRFSGPKPACRSNRWKRRNTKTRHRAS